MIPRYLPALFLIVAPWTYAQTEALPKAESILDRYVEVTGGKAAYEKLKNLTETGVLELAAQGLKGTITRYTAPPAEEYAVTEIEGVGKIEEGLHDGIAWERNPMMGPHVKSGAEKAQALRAGTFNESIRWRELYPSVETMGTEVVDGEICYKLILTPKEGHPETRYFQKKSGLAVKIATIATSQMGDVPFEAFSSEYKSFGGVSIPTKLTQKFGGQEIIITIQDVKINQALPKDRFEPPADIKALLNKAGDKK